MFANIFHSRRPVPDYARSFVEEIAVQQFTAPDPRVERIILICWILIAIKHVVVIWAVHHYQIPFHQLWVNAPTWLFATVATLVYYSQRRPDSHAE